MLRMQSSIMHSRRTLLVLHLSVRLLHTLLSPYQSLVSNPPGVLFSFCYCLHSSLYAYTVASRRVCKPAAIASSTLTEYRLLLWNYRYCSAYQQVSVGLVLPTDTDKEELQPLHSFSRGFLKVQSLAYQESTNAQHNRDKNDN